MSSVAMSKVEREAFLGETHVGILSVGENERGPLTVPIWYSYGRDGVVRFVISSASRKAKLLRSAPRATLCVQGEAMPYKYVSVEGRVAIREEGPEPEETRLARRYLGDELGDRYMAATAAERAAVPNVLVCLQPERWFAADYGKMPL